MLRGMCTVTYTADDVEAAVAWYTDLLGIVLSVMSNPHWAEQHVR